MITQTKESFFKKTLDKLWINKKFHTFSESEICLDTNFITSPVDGTIAYFWNVWSSWEFISKWGKKVHLTELMWEKAKDFAGYKYINIYLSPKNRHFFVSPYEAKITKTFANNWKAFLPIFIWIENFLKLEVFHKAIISNATLSAIFETHFWKMCFIAVWSLNVNHIKFDFEEEKELKKWEKFWHFSLGSSVILIFPDNFEICKKEWESLVIGERLVEVSF